MLQGRGSVKDSPVRLYLAGVLNSRKNGPRVIDSEIFSGRSHLGFILIYCMSNVLKIAKKALTLGVVSSTILWSSMVSVLVPSVAQAASCPVLNPGDMIKVTGKAAIYAVNNSNKVLYFPSGDEFKSWRPTYGGYVSVSQDCFDSLQVPSTYPGAVNFHPGSYVVKRPSSDQLYVVEPGNTLAKVTPEAAKALYGTGYKVMTVADAFWPHYVNRGADVTEGKPHPGMLVMNGGKTWYVDTDMKLREVTATGMTANGFQSKFVHVVTDAMIAGMSFGDKIDAEVKALTDKTQSGGVAAPTTPVAGGSLSLALASDNPFSATVVSDNASTSNGAQAMIPVLKVVFTAGNDGDVKVTSLKLKRGGVSADTDISNMYLYDGDMLVASNPSIANNMVTFSNSNGVFTVSKGSSKTILVKLDLKNSVSAGKTLSFGVNAASDVVPAASSGSFPLVGNTFTTASVTDLGKLALSNVSPTVAGTVDPGTTNFEVWRMQAQGSNQDMELRKLKITMVGSVNPGDLKNFGLFAGATQIGSTVAEMASDKTVTFDFSSAPYVITKGQTKQLSVRADVVGGTNRTFYASIQNSGDVITFDKNYGVFVKTNGTDSFTIVQAGGSSSVNWTVNTGTLSQTLSSDSPTGNVASSSVNTILARFMWKANGEDIKVSSLNVSSTITGGPATPVLKNVRLLVDGSQVGSTISSLTANGASNNGWGTFGSSFIVKSGTSAKVEISADLTDTSIGAGQTITVGTPAGSSNGQGTVSLTNVSSVLKNGNTLTVKGGTVNVTKNASFGDKSSTNPTGPVNAQAVKVASFVVTAGAGEDVELSQVVLKDNSSNCIGTSLQNVLLKDASGKQLGATWTNPGTSSCGNNSNTFNITPAVTISNGAQYVVDVYADLKASLSATAIMKVDSVTATGKNTGTDASYSTAVALQNMFVSSSGALMVQTDSDTSVATNQLMGQTDQVIGKFKISASSTEAVNITQLVVSGIFSSGATGTVRNIRLVDDATGQQVGSAVSAFSDTVAGTNAATTTYSHATFSSLNLQIAKGTSKTLSVKVDFTSYEDTGLSTTGQTVALVVLRTYYGSSGNNPVTATGASSGTSLTATISDSGTIQSFAGAIGGYGSTSTLYRAKLTTAWASDTPSGASSPSSAQTIAKFVITNLANSGSYTATVNLVNFNFSTTISAAAGASMSQAMNVYKDSLSTTALATTYWTYTGASTGNPYAMSGNTIITDANFTDVDIAAGASKTFYVTQDTSAAASTKSLSVRIAGSQVTWTDGVSSSLTVMGQDLPLQFKTFTY